MENKFEIDISHLKIASSEDSVSETIESLLMLNDRIPAQTDKEITDLTEKQLDSGEYHNKKSRGEKEDITEIQFGKREEQNPDVLEVKLEEADSSEGGNHPEKPSKEKVRGHKPENVQPIWLEVFKKEDDRKKNKLEKKLKK